MKRLIKQARSPLNINRIRKVKKGLYLYIDYNATYLTKKDGSIMRTYKGVTSEEEAKVQILGEPKIETSAGEQVYARNPDYSRTNEDALADKHMVDYFKGVQNRTLKRVTEDIVDGEGVKFEDTISKETVFQNSKVNISDVYENFVERDILLPDQKDLQDAIEAYELQQSQKSYKHTIDWVSE